MYFLILYFVGHPAGLVPWSGDSGARLRPSGGGDQECGGDQETPDHPNADQEDHPVLRDHGGPPRGHVGGAHRRGQNHLLHGRSKVKVDKSGSTV